MTEQEQAEVLARWLEAGARGDPPEGLDPDVLEAVWALRPDLAPPPRVSVDDILDAVTSGPFVDADDEATGGEVVPFPVPTSAPTPIEVPAPVPVRDPRRLWVVGATFGALAAAAAIVLALPAVVHETSGSGADATAAKGSFDRARSEPTPASGAAPLEEADLAEPAVADLTEPEADDRDVADGLRLEASGLRAGTAAQEELERDLTALGYVAAPPPPPPPAEQVASRRADATAPAEEAIPGAGGGPPALVVVSQTAGRATADDDAVAMDEAAERNASDERQGYGAGVAPQDAPAASPALRPTAKARAARAPAASSVDADGFDIPARETEATASALDELLDRAESVGTTQPLAGARIAAAGIVPPVQDAERAAEVAARLALRAERPDLALGWLQQALDLPGQGPRHLTLLALQQAAATAQARQQASQAEAEGLPTP